jgi:hypothetical protein
MRRRWPYDSHEPLPTRLRIISTGTRRSTRLFEGGNYFDVIMRVSSRRIASYLILIVACSSSERAAPVLRSGSMRTVRAEIEGEAHYRVPELNRQRAVGVRQAAQSRIITNAHRINQGLIPDLRPPEEYSDFYFVRRQSS